VLRINHSKIEDISFVRNLVNLEELYFTYNNISDLTPLASLTNLKVLWLDSNYIENIAPLNNLINLEKLIITYNCIEECALYYDHTENITKGECDKLENLINIDGIYISSFSQFKEVCEGNLDWNEFLGNRN
jgi:Leucine-rich repeat (LRR) protein